MHSLHKGTALITGASSGIGAVYAAQLARRGYDLILVARNAAKLNELARNMTDETGMTIEVATADLTHADDLARIETMLRTDSSITLLVNNAGVGATVPLLQSDVGSITTMITLNVLAAARLVHAAAPGFVARGRGTIINIASIVAVAPELLNGIYGGSKAFLLAFSQSLQHELGDKGVQVQVVLPGAVSTPFWDLAGTPVDQLPEGIVMSAEHMVAAALAGLDAGETVTIPSLPDFADWTTYEAARAALAPGLSRSVPAPRYGIV